MISPPPIKKVAWNRGLVVGPKRAFSLEDLAGIETRLIAHAKWHDLALLSFGLDTMLRSSDLLTTKVWQIKYANAPIRTLIARRQRKTRHIVNRVLTPPSRRYLMTWLEKSGKGQQDFVFTRSKPTNAALITRAHYGGIVKTWASWLGYDSEEFSSHSIRRSKPAYMYWAGEDIGLISRLLGPVDNHLEAMREAARFQEAV